ncbi:MAG: EFR1 family ferrodoxin [Roseburia sp.]|nr:EFR1 family ferrodoxin [Roseburia sp.]
MTILYFTATGNSLYVAKNLGGTLVSIPQAIKNGQYEFSDDAIGIVCPTYSHLPPKCVLKFLQSAKLNAKYLFMVLTYGNRHSGAAYLSAEKCKEFGITLNYAATVKMVDNYLPVFDMDEQKSIDKHVDEQINEVKNAIAKRENYIPDITDEDLQWHEAGKKRNASMPAFNDGSQIKVLTDKCIGCGICAKVCPIGNFYLENGIAKRKSEQCEFCLACANLCTNKAIVCSIMDKNVNARYRNEQISLCEIVKSNNQN